MIAAVNDDGRWMVLQVACDSTRRLQMLLLLLCSRNFDGVHYILGVPRRLPMDRMYRHTSEGVDALLVFAWKASLTTHVL